MKATVGAFATVLVTVWQAYPLAQPAPVGQLGPESAILRRAAADILDGRGTACPISSAARRRQRRG